MKTQVKTVNTTYKSIMRTKYFKLGVEDIKNKNGWHKDYDSWNINAQWGYERGRAYAIHTKGAIPVKNGRAVTREAIYAFFQGSQEKSIL